MKTLLAITCATACLCLAGCTGSESDEVAIESKDVRPVGEQVAPPGDDIKLNSSKTAGGTAPARPKDE